MERILDHLRGRRDEMLALARELALLESPSRVPEAQEPLFVRLAAALEEVGLRPRRLQGKTSGGQIFAAPPHPRKPGQLLVGHCDTVWPMGTLERMPVELRDGRLYGPGTYDMKAGLVQGIFALRALRDLGLEPPLAPSFFINSDEELGSVESADRIRRLARRVRRVFVLEPSLGPEGKLKTARKGIWRFRVTVRGRAAHSGLDPEKGASAILALAQVIQSLYALADPDRGVTVNVGVIGGGVTFNVVAPEAWAEVDVRVLRAEDGQAFERAFRAMEPAVPGTSFEIEGGMNRYPLEPNPRNRALWHAAERCARRLGIELGEGTAGGGSDGNFTSQHAATLDGLGAVGDGAHALHEHVVIDRMPERAALLAGLLLEPVA
ncbi:MAG TPA: M20/M25/M40 family metallo-hydrolase [Thermoanaerobaculia bacterium]|nr:M20/M25/M40 family metallo-hydrolase [Thermoanaerobaculia bacterium]